MRYRPEYEIPTRFEAERDAAEDRKMGPPAPHRPLHLNDDPWVDAVIDDTPPF